MSDTPKTEALILELDQHIRDYRDGGTTFTVADTISLLSRARNALAAPSVSGGRGAATVPPYHCNVAREACSDSRCVDHYGRGAATQGPAEPVETLHDTLTDALLLQMSDEAIQAEKRARHDAREHGGSDHWIQSCGDAAWCETVRSFLAQAGVIAPRREES